MEIDEDRVIVMFAPFAKISILTPFTSVGAGGQMSLKYLMSGNYGHLLASLLGIKVNMFPNDEDNNGQSHLPSEDDARLIIFVI